MQQNGVNKEALRSGILLLATNPPKLGIDLATGQWMGSGKAARKPLARGAKF